MMQVCYYDNCQYSKEQDLFRRRYNRVLALCMLNSKPEKYGKEPTSMSRNLAKIKGAKQLIQTILSFACVKVGHVYTVHYSNKVPLTKKIHQQNPPSFVPLFLCPEHKKYIGAYRKIGAICRRRTAYTMDIYSYVFVSYTPPKLEDAKIEYAILKHNEPLFSSVCERDSDSEKGSNMNFHYLYNSYILTLEFLRDLIAGKKYKQAYDTFR